MEYPKDQFLCLFFILFINDMPTILKDSVNTNLNLYADDTSLTIYADNNSLLTKYLQFYIDKLVYWFNIIELKLNIEKTKMLPIMNARIYILDILKLKL